MPETILVEIDGKVIGPLLQTDSKSVIPKSLEAVPPTSNGVQPRIVSFSVEPGELICGAFETREMVRWVADTLSRAAMRRNIALIVTQPMARTGKRIDLRDCIITDVVFPALSRSSKAAASMKVTFKAEGQANRDVEVTPGVPRLREWSASGFEFGLAGFETVTVVAVSAFRVRQGVNQTPSGMHRETTYSPGRLDLSSITVTVPTHAADPMLAWFDDIGTGSKRRGPVAGYLRYLASGGKVVANLNLHDVVPVKLVKMPVAGFTFELSIDRVQLEAGPS